MASVAMGSDADAESLVGSDELADPLPDEASLDEAEADSLVDPLSDAASLADADPEEASVESSPPQAASKNENRTPATTRQRKELRTKTTLR